MENKYLLLHPTNHNAGLFSYIWQTMRAIHHNPDKLYYFYFGHECSYYDGSYPAGFNNAWDYYFEQPHNTNFPNNIENEIGNIEHPYSEFREGVDFGLSYEEYNNRRFIYNQIISKYIKPKHYLEQKINDFYNLHFKDKNIVGIHCRGTDHPNSTDISKFLMKITDIAKEYDYIFATSDEQHKIDILKSHFGEKLLTYNTFRSPDGQPVHISLRHMHSPRLIGEEALIEAYLLAKTNLLLIYTGSNVNFYVRALNPHLPYINLQD